VLAHFVTIHRIDVVLGGAVREMRHDLVPKEIVVDPAVRGAPLLLAEDACPPTGGERE